MSFIQTKDPFDVLYMRSPMPKVLLTPLSEHLSHLKENSVLSASRSPLPVNKSNPRLHEQTLHNSFISGIPRPQQSVSDYSSLQSNAQNICHLKERISNTWQNGNFSESVPEENEDYDQVDGFRNNSASLFGNSIMEPVSPFDQIRIQHANQSNNQHFEDFENQEPSFNQGPIIYKYPIEASVSVQTFREKPTIEVPVQDIDTNKNEPVKLFNWIIKPLPEVKGICVEGKKHPDDDQYFQCSIVYSRSRPREVTTGNGSKYTLVGDIEFLDAIDAGITEDVARKFKSGFPIQWKSIISEYYKKVRFIDEEDTVLQDHPHEPDKQDTLENNTKTTTVTKTIETRPKEYVLVDWIIKPIRDTEDICVEGKKSGTDSEEYWHSTAIDHVVNKKTLVTTSGSIYKLEGKISALDMLEAEFIALDLDLFVAVRTAPHQSYNNPAERVMSLLNLGLQNVSLTREEMEIKKCSLEDVDKCTYCCLSRPRLPDELYKNLHFLPDPVLDPISGEYKPFDSVYGKETDDSARPSLKFKPEASERDKKHKSLLTAAKVRGYVSCFSCGKRRVVYSAAKLTVQQERALIRVQEELLYCCGAILFPGGDNQDKLIVKESLSCESPMEVTYYAGFSEKTIKAFTDGFPRYWRRHIEGHFARMKAIHRNKNEHLTPKAEQAGKSDNSTGCTATGTVFELDSIKKTRSGRVSKPMLAWWAGQKVKVNDDNTFELTYNSPKTPEILKTMSNSYKNINRRYQAYLNTSSYSLSGFSSDSSVTDTKQQNKAISGKKNKQKDISRKSTEKPQAALKRRSSEKRKSDSNDGPKAKLKKMDLNHSIHASSKSKKKVSSRVMDKKVDKKDTKTKTQDSAKDKDIDGLIEDLETTVTKSRTKRKSNVTKKDTCYSKAGSESQVSLSEDTYSVDLDPDFDKDDENVAKGRKSRSKSKKGKKAPEVKTRINSKDNKTVENKPSEKSTSRSSRPRSKSSNAKVSKTTEEDVGQHLPEKRKTRSKSQAQYKAVDSTYSSEEESDDDFSTRTGTVKANRTQSRIQKPVRQPEPEVVNKDKPWTKEEINLFNKAVVSVPGDHPNYWEMVSQKIKTRTSEECIEYNFKEAPRSNKKKPPKKNTVGEKKPLVAITAKKGTLKRKQQLRELVEQHNDGYEDDLFDATPYRKHSNIKIPNLMDDEDGDIFEEMAKKHPNLLNRIYTPLTRVYIDPVSEKKTPASSLESPWTNVDRKEAEQYIHHLQKRRQMKGRKILDRAKTPVNKKQPKNSASPTKNLFGKSGKAKDIFEEDGNSSENYDDSENEQDYYWSDMDS